MTDATNDATVSLTKHCIRDLLTDLNVSPSKSKGQNFVHDLGTLSYITHTADLHAEDSVLEIGSGLGSLTLNMLQTGAKVMAVEIEHAFYEKLPVTAQKLTPDFAQNLNVINFDALQLTKKTFTEQGIQPNFNKLVANLPYNIATPVLLRILDEFETIQCAVIMVQKEVAERLCAAPDSKIYGVPSAKLAYYGDAQLKRIVKKQVFYPEPNVESQIVLFTRNIDNRKNESVRAKAFELIDSAFQTRRKMLKSALKTYPNIENILHECDINPNLRAENLSIHDYVKIAGLYTNSASVYVPAKINLWLKIVGIEGEKHLLDTLFYPLTKGTGETVTLLKSTTDHDRIITQCETDAETAKLPAQSGNIVTKAIESFRAQTGDTQKYTVLIDKHTPISGGMAGGSADAAGTLYLLNQFADQQLTEQELLKIAAELGADIPYLLTMLQKCKLFPALGTHFGDTITEAIDSNVPELSTLANQHYVIFTFNFGLSTAKMYTESDKFADSRPTTPHLYENDLQTPAIIAAPVIETVINFAKSHGATHAFVTGSGPTVIAVCETASTAQKLQKTASNAEFMRENGLRKVFVSEADAMRDLHHQEVLLIPRNTSTLNSAPRNEV
ncbi:MAG: 16S rRNA (adenine(1518)-N(6)/adenine(1519)-N(6))-dimethyltransferase RsmA [Bifidobacteriaceae bacterium]|jgi:16S rRNA (adenine1518-N6/adenine1519-N6)-dimethyltransferase|nr:16S rRNA (adenine(1518)-N(6)/adenine(1519)-N(6))-dimethyltransferase RsmA [Bifidobacteriaceae bacterium]